MRPEILQFFAKFIERELGIVYAEHNFFQLQNRLEEISKIIGEKSVSSLFEKAKNEGISGDFKQLLLDIATNNETSFFRDSKVFRAIESKIVPALATRLPAVEKIRIWSAASSFGQEPYTIAIMLTEMQKTGSLKHDFEVLASDISTRVLERAKTGRYSQLEVQRGLSAPLLLKYFTKDDENFWTLTPEIRNRVKFLKQNLKEPLALGGKFDVILCRNVLIYQTVESKREILSRVRECLLPGGFLILGAGESLLGITDDYEANLVDDVVYYKLKERRVA